MYHNQGQNMCDCSCSSCHAFQGGMNTNGCGMSYQGGCPRPQPLVAPKKVCVTNQVTPVEQPVICPIECRRVNHCMYYPVYYPQYTQTFVNQSNLF